MKLFHLIKEGGAVGTGLNIMTNDRNAYVNIRLKLPLFIRYKLDEHFVLDQGVWYYGVVVSPIWQTRLRIRTWAFTSYLPSVWQRLKAMMLVGSRIDLRTIRWDWDQTQEDREDRIGLAFKQ